MNGSSEQNNATEVASNPAPEATAAQTETTQTATTAPSGKVTHSQIASKLGIDRSIVTRVLNGKSNSPKKELILATAAEMGYVAPIASEQATASQPEAAPEVAAQTENAVPENAVAADTAPEASTEVAAPKAKPKSKGKKTAKKAKAKKFPHAAPRMMVNADILAKIEAHPADLREKLNEARQEEVQTRGSGDVDDATARLLYKLVHDDRIKPEAKLAYREMEPIFHLKRNNGMCAYRIVGKIEAELKRKARQKAAEARAEAKKVEAPETVNA
jgi:transcriptional regulator with XRE-family HTH domain